MALKTNYPEDFYWIIVKESFEKKTVKNTKNKKSNNMGNNTLSPKQPVVIYTIPVFFLLRISYPVDYITNFQLSPLDEKVLQKIHKTTL